MAQVNPVACKVAFVNWACDENTERDIINSNDSFFICLLLFYEPDGAFDEQHKHPLCI